MIQKKATHLEVEKFILKTVGQAVIVSKHNLQKREDREPLYGNRSSLFVCVWN